MRSIWKIKPLINFKYYISKKNNLILNKSLDIEEKFLTIFKNKNIFKKSTLICKEFLGNSFNVYNGNKIYKVHFKENSLFLLKKFGMFISTRKMPKHPLLKKDKKKKN